MVGKPLMLTSCTFLLLEIMTQSKDLYMLFWACTAVYELKAPEELLPQRCKHIKFFWKLLLPSIFPVPLYPLTIMYEMPVLMPPTATPLETSLLHNWITQGTTVHLDYQISWHPKRQQPIDSLFYQYWHY